jgi:hypothetical protein
MLTLEDQPTPQASTTQDETARDYGTLLSFFLFPSLPCYFFFCVCVCVVLGVELRASHTVGKFSTNEPQLQCPPIPF